MGSRQSLPRWPGLGCSQQENLCGSEWLKQGGFQHAPHRVIHCFLCSMLLGRDMGSFEATGSVAGHCWVRALAPHPVGVRPLSGNPPWGEGPGLGEGRLGWLLPFSGAFITYSLCFLLHPRQHRGTGADFGDDQQ